MGHSTPTLNVLGGLVREPDSILQPLMLVSSAAVYQHTFGKRRFQRSPAGIRGSVLRRFGLGPSDTARPTCAGALGSVAASFPSSIMAGRAISAACSS